MDGAGNVYVLAKTASYGSTKTILVAKLNIAGGLVYYSRFGGTGDDRPQGIAVDSAGNTYVTGTTLSVDFSVSSGAFQKVRGAAFDAFVTKLNASGSTLVYSTFLGGDGGDSGNDIAVDAYGYAYVVGTTTHPASGYLFPTSNVAFQTVPKGASDAFVIELFPDSSPFYSTLLGGSANDEGHGIAVDGAYNAHVVGLSQSANFPTKAGAFRTGSTDGFVMELNALGSAALYATYLGGNSVDTPLGVAVDSSGNAYVAGWTDSNNFPVFGAAQSTYGGNVDGFLTKFKGP